MDRRKTLVSLGGADENAAEAVEGETGPTAPEAGDHAPVFEEVWDEPVSAGSRLVPVLAMLVALAWTAFFIWSHLPDFRLGVTPGEGAALVSVWAVPVALIVGLWLLAMRNSTREATRFGAAAQALANESQALERRLSAVNAELSLARDFIAAQSRDLEALGRMAAERLSANASQLQDLIRDNGAQVNAIGEVSGTALANMDKLRDRLPVVANSARDLTSQIGHAGNTAQARLDDLVAGIQRLTATGEASGLQVDIVRENVNQTLTAFEQRLASLQAAQDEAHQRFTLAAQQMHDRVAQAIDDIQQIDESAMSNSRRRIEALGEAETKVRAQVAESDAAFTVKQAEREAAIEATQAAALAALHEQMAAFDTAVVERHERHVAHLATLAERGEALATRLTELDGEIARLANTGDEHGTKLLETSREFSRQLDLGRGLLDDHRLRVSDLTDGSVRLLELIRAGADHSQGALAQAIAQADARLSAFEGRVAALGSAINEAEAKGGALAGHVDATNSSAAELLGTLATLDGRLAGLSEQARDVSTRSSQDLAASLAALEESATATVAQLQSGQADAVRAIAGELGETASTMLRETIGASGAAAIADLQHATDAATEQGRATVKLLRDQLAKVNQLAGNLEQRVAEARAQAEEQVNSDFTRRMALITDSLNSCSIDIARALDAEVTDMAWASYLKGDRGIFTRRAVRLLDTQEVRAIGDAYDNDDGLRQAVNRYIHDFEALLRPILSTRDGNAMAVTLLSSDIGKLYVVLAQAIERLRD